MKKIPELIPQVTSPSKVDEYTKVLAIVCRVDILVPQDCFVSTPNTSECIVARDDKSK